MYYEVLHDLLRLNWDFPLLPNIAHSSYYNIIHNNGNQIQKDVFFYEM